MIQICDPIEIYKMIYEFIKNTRIQCCYSYRTYVNTNINSLKIIITILKIKVLSIEYLISKTATIFYVSRIDLIHTNPIQSSYTKDWVSIDGSSISNKTTYKQIYKFF